MAVVYEKVVAEDLNLGNGAIGDQTLDAPNGGTMPGTQINLATFATAASASAARAGSVGWQPGTIQGGKYATLNLTSANVGSFIAGDIVLVSFSQMLAGCAIFANVIDSTTLTVFIVNTTTTSLNLALGTLKVLVFRLP